MSRLPVIDVADLLAGRESSQAVRQIHAACRDLGFFYAVGHGVSADVLQRLTAASWRFFALPDEQKREVEMARAGQAWRGWFPLGGELTSGRPDRKEGFYFGEELGPDDARVVAGLPLHGANLFPQSVPELRGAVLDLMRDATHAAHAILEGIALSLQLPRDYFRAHLTAQPTLLFRVFHYPPASAADENWGVGEHTDYGLLTLLAQDEAGGLQVKTPQGWIAAPPIDGALVCNLGDMLDRLTGGYYRSTPHRVRNASGRGRLSFPFFFDPGWHARIEALPAARDDSGERWDRANVHAFEGTYGDYLLGKVSKVFPELATRVRTAP